ncbi:membrane lipoprotein lipid attachment site-containing protein [Jeotgalibacillus soli]|uniref:Lipoprotein n=1 Tax=Jeotgalibacillus soli TaxID=889306 RepID=A0A0C2V7X3_9BACL|nr:membrane lipoprotein lipid attachment site-containing protein [Jeotgalibacillus soli]KIL45052.1 hypothetical protein KP78_25960 [Jeotgalibacillus soli]
MKKFLYLIFLMLVLTGCNILTDNKELYYTEVIMESTDKAVQKFINEVKEKNGIYLYQDAGERLFVFLNNVLVEQGSEAIFFSGFDIKNEKDTVNIYFNQETKKDYVNKDLNNQVLYEVKLDKEYDYIKLFSNNEETHFSLVTGG